MSQERREDRGTVFSLSKRHPQGWHALIEIKIYSVYAAVGGAGEKKIYIFHSLNSYLSSFRAGTLKVRDWRMRPKIIQVSKKCL